MGAAFVVAHPIDVAGQPRLGLFLAGREAADAAAAEALVASLATTAATELWALARGLPRRRAMDEAVCGITVADARAPDLPLVFVNATFCRMTGYPEAEVIGRNCRFL